MRKTEIYRYKGYFLALPIFLAVGCAAASEAGPVEWVEPAWIARTRQEVEIYQAEMSACITEFGLIPGPAIGGIMGTAFYGEAPADWSEISHYALNRCSETVDLPYLWVSPGVVSEQYERMMDSHICISLLGFELPEPPPLEVWADSSDENIWSPHWYAQARFSLRDDDLEELMNACPMPAAGRMIAIADNRIFD